MALRVWLPLNGTLENQGISNVAITNNGATVDNNGKIGKCYSFDGTDDYLEINYCIHEWSFSNQYSICFWIKPTDSTNRQIIGTTNYSWVILRDNNKLHFNQWDSGGSHTNTMNIDGGTLPIDTWSHCAITWNSRVIKLYINGAEVASVTATTTATNKTTNENIKIGGNIYSWSRNSYFKGCLNDFRVYDHCLSPKEVKEISQGLVLHYKLDSSYIENTTNYLLNPKKDSYTANSQAWDASLHEGAILPNGWANGYNSGVSSPSVGYHAMWKIIENIPTIVFINHNSTYSLANRWLGVNSNTTTMIPAGTKYTISFEQKAVDVAGGYVTAGIYYKINSSATSRSFHDGCPSFGTIERVGEWERVSYTFTRSSSFDGNENGSIYIYGHYGIECTKYVRNVQLEIKDHATAYTESSRTNVIVKDSSGYENNGTAVGDLTFKKDSNRYNIVLSHPDDCSQYIYRDALSFLGESGITFACWAKCENYTRTSNNVAAIGSQFIVSQGRDYRVDSTYTYGMNLIMNNGIPQLHMGDGTLSSNLQITLDTWVHIVGTWDGATKKIYVNGELKNSAAETHVNWSNNDGNKFVVAKMSHGYTGTATYFPFVGEISDVRVYATALSAEDIKDLYNVSASIDNLGNIHSFEFLDNKENILFPTVAPLISKNWNDSTMLKNYTQANCQVTLTDNGLRIYRPPNLIHDSSTMHNMWGGMRLANTSDGNKHIYNTNDNTMGLQKGHTYILLFHVRGQSSNAVNNLGWDNQMGWGGGGLSPNPSNISYLVPGANFNGEMECWYKWTINDDIVKTCTTSYSYATAGNDYLSYADFKFGWQYSDTGALGSDVYITNIRMYDITDQTNDNIFKNGQVIFNGINQLNNDKASIHLSKELNAIGFIEK